MAPIAAIARANDMKIVDDAAHALGTVWRSDDGAVQSRRRQRIRRPDDLLVSPGEDDRDGRRRRGQRERSGIAPPLEAGPQSRHHARSARVQARRRELRCVGRGQSLVLRARGAGLQLAHLGHQLRARDIAAVQASALHQCAPHPRRVLRRIACPARAAGEAVDARSALAHRLAHLRGAHRFRRSLRSSVPR